MAISIAQPAWGILAGIILLAGILALRATRDRSWRWRRSVLIWPMVAAIAAALAASGNAVEKHARDFVLLVDCSPSARTSPWHNPAWLKDLAQKHLPGDARLTVIGIGGGGARQLLERTTLSVAWPAAWPPVDMQSLETPGVGDGLATALQWREPDENDATLHPRWIITDGLAGLAPNVGEKAIAWTVIPPQPADLAVRDIQLRALGDADVEVLVQVAATGGTRAELTLFENNTRLGSEPIDLALADADHVSRWVSFRPPPAASAATARTFRAVIRPASGTADPWPENDTGTAQWRPADMPRVLVVSREKPAAIGNAAFVRTEDFTAGTGALLAGGWQTVILHDVPAEGIGALPPGAAEILTRYVREGGGGLLLTGAGHAFGPGSYGEGSPTGEALETLSPVWSHPRQGKNVRVVFLLDASASMNEPTGAGGQRRFTLLASAVESAANMLSADDPLTVITFSGEAQTVASGTAGNVRANLRERLAAIAPSGPTALDGALEPARAALHEPAPATIVVLVSDGEIPALDVPAWSTLLARPDVRTVLITPPIQPNTPLARLGAAIPNARHAAAHDPAMWSDLLRREIAERVRGGHSSDDLPWRTLRDEAPAGTSHSWTRTWAKAEATILAEGKQAEATIPIAATAQRGLGRVGAITVAPDNSPAWQALLARMLTDISAPHGNPDFHATASRRDNHWHITVDAASSGNFLNNRTLTLHPIESTPIPMQQTGPGRYEAAGRITGPLHAVITQKSEGQDQLVVRIQTPDVQTTEWPATVEPHGKLPGTQLPANAETHWSPPAQQRISLNTWAWLTAALAALLALWRR